MSASDESPVGGEEMMEGVEQGVGCAINKTKFGGCGLAILFSNLQEGGSPAWMCFEAGYL